MIKRAVPMFIGGMLLSLVIPVLAAPALPQSISEIFLLKEDAVAMLDEYDANNVDPLRERIAALEGLVNDLEKNIEYQSERISSIEATLYVLPSPPQLCTFDSDCESHQYCEIDENACLAGPSDCPIGQTCVRACMGMCKNLPFELPPPLPVCGNSMCEAGEAETMSAGGCGPNSPPECLGPPASVHPGTCPADCLRNQPPVCGNNICEEGEADTMSGGGCGPGSSPDCLGPPASVFPGSCANDCTVQGGPAELLCVTETDCPSGNACIVDPNNCQASVDCAVGSECMAACMGVCYEIQSGPAPQPLPPLSGSPNGPQQCMTGADCTNGHTCVIDQNSCGGSSESCPAGSNCMMACTGTCQLPPSAMPSYPTCMMVEGSEWSCGIGH